jgi:hypothetical protein
LEKKMEERYEIEAVDLFRYFFFERFHLKSWTFVRMGQGSP